MFYMNEKNTEFNIIWEKTIKPLIEDFSNTYGLLGHSSNFTMRLMRHYYNKYRNIFIKSFMVDETVKIDRHKIASCMTKAVLMTKPLRIKFKDFIKLILFKKNLTKKSKMFFMANELLSLTIAINIIESYIDAIAKEYEELKRIKPEIKNYIHLLKSPIYFPVPFRDYYEDYIEDVCLDLYYTGARKFNIITYANIFFLLEKYTCRRVQSENFESQCRKLLKKDKGNDLENINEIIEEIRFKSLTDNKTSNELPTN